MDYLVSLVVMVMWITGIVLAKGFLSTAAAMCIPPYAWYLVIEYVLALSGYIK